MRRVWGQVLAAPWVVLGILEASLVALGCGIGLYHVLAGPLPVGNPATGVIAITGASGIILLMYSGGLYDRGAVLDLRRVLWRTAIITAPVFGFAMLVTGAVAKYTSAPVEPYQWTSILTAVWLITAVSLRLFLRELHRAGYLTQRVLFLGPARQGADLCKLANLTEDAFRIVAQIDPSSFGDGQNFTDIAARAHRVHASEIVVALEKGNPALWEALLKCRFSGVRVTEYLDFFERESKRICVDNLRDEWIALSGGFRFGKAGDLARRVTDGALAIAILLASAPVMLLTALAIKLEDGGSVFYRQERIGLHGRPFVVLKFRSMKMDAERDGMPVWARERDSRTTLVGRLIRKIRIDELPQFLNVLSGSMAIIGPRPERPYFVEQFSRTIPFYDYRHAVKPGITGWAQVSFRYGASLEDTKRKLSYDLYYIKNRSFVFDLVILLRTVGVVLRGDGAR